MREWGNAGTLIILSHAEQDMRHAMTMANISIDDLKAQAKRLRTTMAADGMTVSHSKALELVAKSHGARDWNTVAAQASREDNRHAPPTTVGAVVEGTYLGQRFRGRVLSLTGLSDGAHWQISLHFDEPVDVVTFDSFSAFRQRVSGTIDAKGVSPRRTSDGNPHIMLNL